MMFLSRKDPIGDTKEILYERKALLEQFHPTEVNRTWDGNSDGGRLTQIENEIAFINNLLDIIERST